MSRARLIDDPLDEADESSVQEVIHRARWTGERIARLGFLVGLGFDAKRIAADPIIASTTNNVHRQAQRFGVAFRVVPVPKLSGRHRAFLDAAAAKRGLTREALVHTLLLEIVSEPTLLDNILDDGVL